MKPGIYEMTNEEYHASPGVNKSTLDMVLTDPASIQWAKRCPVDHQKTKAIDFGSAFHTAVLEPELFDAQYSIEPKVNKRTNAGKAEIAEFLKANAGKTILTADDHKQLELMQGSVYAHPIAKAILDNKTGVEVSIFARDPATGPLLKSRNDVEAEINGKKIIADLKTISDIDQISKAIHERKYHLQHHHYCEVYKLHHGVYPDHFLFIFVSKKIALGRYPVKVVEIDGLTKEIGADLWEEAITTYSDCEINDTWPGVCTVGLPNWALRG